ncbi:MAG: hypothetical protein NTZ74_00200 [Chloroflexi bacterium]|nr:hypothetical protein [Chloroflexota bacterium]
MIKKIIWMFILLAVTACTVFFGGEGNTPVITPSPTAVICANCTLEPTLTSEVLPTAIGATATLEEGGLISDLTVTPEITEIVAATPIPTATPLPTQIPPTPTPTIAPVVVLFDVQSATPVFMVNFIHTSEGCAWQGVAGQLFDKNGDPVLSYIVKVAGTFDGQPFAQITVTGIASGSPYGPGGYEVVLGNKAVDSIDLLAIQLFDPQGSAITAPLPFSTSSSCTKNLVLINFTEK